MRKHIVPNFDTLRSNLGPCDGHDCGNSLVLAALIWNSIKLNFPARQNSLWRLEVTLSPIKVRGDNCPLCDDARREISLTRRGLNSSPFYIKQKYNHPLRTREVKGRKCDVTHRICRRLLSTNRRSYICVSAWIMYTSVLQRELKNVTFCYVGGNVRDPNVFWICPVIAQRFLYVMSRL